MNRPTFENLNKNIVKWVQDNFVKAMLPFHVQKNEFKFARVVEIPRVWKEIDHWLVEARIEYALGQPQWATITFQVNDEGEIVGYKVSKCES